MLHAFWAQGPLNSQKIPKLKNQPPSFTQPSSPHSVVLVAATPASCLFPFIVPQPQNFCSGQLKTRQMAPLCCTVTVCGLVLCVLVLNQSKLMQSEHCLSFPYPETEVFFPVCTVLLAQKGWKSALRLSEMGKSRCHKWVVNNLVFYLNSQR